MRAPINLNRFDLVTLRLFVASVDGGSLSAGAARFGLSVAAASKRIAELEGHVGSQLLRRSKKGVSPTAAGHMLLQHAAQVVAGLEQLALTMDDFRRGVGGHLRLWANPSAFSGFLPGLLAEFLAAHPTVVLDLDETLSSEAVRAVASGAIELGIIGDNTPCEGLESLVCEVDELILLLPAGHLLAGAERVDVREALALDLVGLNRSTSLMRQIASVAEAVGTPMKLRVQLRSFDAICRMVAAGFGAAIIPRAAGLPQVKAMGLRIVGLDGFPCQRNLLLIMRNRSTLSPAAQELVVRIERRLQAGSNKI